ncbi:MAG: glycosyltransferase [Alphaproteobacteria bacterium]|nr:MAG: glycosyltransferase [Alphaproteobacteria bacterium]
MDLPRISIVTLSFNQARFLPAALASVREQGYPDIEHIVVDPGSTDASRAIIAAAPGIGPVVLDPDDGPADGLNRGFAAATGAIYGYLNADDRLLPGALAAVARAFAERPDADAICGNGVLIDAEDRVLRPIRTSRISRADIGQGAMTFVQQGHFFRPAALAAAGGLNTANRTCWDYELLVDMLCAGVRVANVPDALGAFRLYGDSITGSGRLATANALDLVRIREKALGRPLAARDHIIAPLRLLARRLASPAATLAGLRARL